MCVQVIVGICKESGAIKINYCPLTITKDYDNLIDTEKGSNFVVYFLLIYHW